MTALTLTPTQIAFRQRVEDALRSGRYRQGRTRMRLPDGRMCFWGVVCDVYDPTRWVDTRRDGIAYSEGNWVMFASPPRDVLFALGEPCFVDFANLNDEGATFDELADTLMLDTLMRTDETQCVATS